MTEGYSFLRFLFNKYSESEYLTEAWTPINEILKQLLQDSIENFKPMSYQAIYSQVYKSTCKGYDERLFNDLKNLIKEHCQNLKVQLDENHYLDVVYIKPKMRSTTQQELLILYKTIIIESHLNHIFTALQHLINTSDSPSKEIISSLLQMINDITPESSIKQRDLFKRYCNGEDIFNEITSNEEDIITSAPRTASKRSVDDLPGEEDQPSAKRTTSMIKSPCSDN